MVIMVIIIVICCRGPAHCQVLRTATDFGLDGIVAPGAVWRRLKQSKAETNQVAAYLVSHGKLGDQVSK